MLSNEIHKRWIYVERTRQEIESEPKKNNVFTSKGENQYKYKFEAKQDAENENED